MALTDWAGAIWSHASTGHSPEVAAAHAQGNRAHIVETALRFFLSGDTTA